MRILLNLGPEPREGILDVFVEALLVLRRM
jgi:hypothetical protein